MHKWISLHRMTRSAFSRPYGNCWRQSTLGVCWCRPTRCTRTALFPLPRPARRRLPDRRQARAPQWVPVDPRSAHQRTPDPLANQQPGNRVRSLHHLGVAGNAGGGLGDGAVAEQCDSKDPLQKKARQTELQQSEKEYNVN